MDSEINQLIRNIKTIQNKDDTYLEYQEIDVVKLSDKSSNTKIPIYKMKIDDTLISRNNSYSITYACINCDRENKVSLNGFMKKINKSIWKCRTCKEHDLDKRDNQSKFMKDSNPQNENYQKPIIIKRTLIEIIETSNIEFNNMDSDFVDKYFTKHMDKDEFDLIKSKIVSIQNDKFNNIEDFEYHPHIKVNNQTLFNPKFYDKKRDSFENPQYIKYKCQKCNLEFINRDLWIQKNRIKILCKDCSFCNMTFKIRSEKNINDQKITYQSKLELKFIKFCNDNKILVEDGPKLDYQWNGKNRRYIVDYYLPKLNLLIELKDDHIWHKKQVNNGVWKSKLESVDKYNLEHGSEYLLIFPKNYVEKTKQILDKI